MSRAAPPLSTPNRNPDDWPLINPQFESEIGIRAEGCRAVVGCVPSYTHTHTHTHHNSPLCTRTYTHKHALLLRAYLGGGGGRKRRGETLTLSHAVHRSLIHTLAQSIALSLKLSHPVYRSLTLSLTHRKWRGKSTSPRTSVCVCVCVCV